MIRDWFSHLPIQKKLLLLNLVTASFSGLFAGVLLLVIVWRVEFHAAEVDAGVKAGIIAENALPALQFNDPRTAGEVLWGLSRDDQVLDARIVRADGSVFASFSANKATPDTLSRGNLIRAEVPLNSGQERLGNLIVTYDTTEVIDEIVLYVGAVGMATLVALLVGSFLVVRLQRIITTPLSQLTQLMHHVTASNDFSRRSDVPGQDELGQLSSSFNRMLEQIELRTTELNHELGERIRAEQQLEHLAHHDQVTGLPNRHSFRQRTGNLMRGKALIDNTMALMFVDLDNFKYVNDTFGHDLGDQLLVGVAERLTAALRAHDMVVRFGGDEFVVLLDRAGDSAQAMVIAQKILATVTEPFALSGRTFIVTCSIGIALAPDHAEDFDELLQKADAAMYSAKASGKNAVRLWESSISARSSHRFVLETDLRQALERQELEMHYQPIIDLADGRIAGMEALMRWRHPSRGFVSPAEFIPVAEDTGLILALGEWAMATAFADCARWVARYGPLFMAVNVSGRQFREPGFADRVDEIATASGLARGLCHLEVTESIIMGHTGEAVRRLQDLSARGFVLSLDDFGTGYSSMSYLKRFPLDKLKIDRSFVKDLPEDVEDRAICEAIIGLAGNLRMRNVAEGIETAAQADMLRAMGCQFGQGYHFSKPLPPDGVARFIEDSLAESAAGLPRNRPPT